MKQVNESILVSGIIQYVQLFENKGVAYVVRNNTIRQTLVRKDGSKGFLSNGKRGSPDLLVCVNGHFIGIECKRKGNKQSDLQSAAQAAIERAGGLYWLVYSFEEFKSRFDGVLNEEPSPV